MGVGAIIKQDELLTYDTPALWQTSKLAAEKNVTKNGHTYMKLVNKYQIPVINSCLEKCEKKCAYTNVC